MNIPLIITMIVILCLITLNLETVITFGAAILLLSIIGTILVANLVNSWFALILFLIYITGLLVIFGYIIAISPNANSPNSYLNNIALIIITISAIQITSAIQLPKNNINYEWEVITIINDYNCTTYWLIATILLVALVMVVSICFNTPSPLRPYLK